MDYRKMLSGRIELQKKVCNRCFLSFSLFFCICFTDVSRSAIKKSNGPFFKTSIREERKCTGLHSYTSFHTLCHKTSLLKTPAKFLGSAPEVALPSTTRQGKRQLIIISHIINYVEVMC